MKMKLILIITLVAVGATSGAMGRSILDLVTPPPMLRNFLNTGGEIVDTLRSGATFAYEDLVSSLGLTSRTNNNNRHPHNGAEVSSEQCDEQSLLEGLCGGPIDADAKRNVSEIIQSRGFESQELDVITRDGYILTIQRIINPLVDANYRHKLKPVILQHGLMSSSVDWVINSPEVRPARFPRAAEVDNRINSIESRWAARKSLGDGLPGDSQEAPNALAFYLANEGYDVYLANSRGNKYGQRHIKMSSWEPAFWSFTFDEQIKYDLPDIIEFVQRLTNHTKLGYVGHSQGTTMALGLLSDRPEFAEIMEPVVLLAPVAYVNHCLSPVRYFSVYTPLFQHLNMWFGSSNVAVKYLAPIVCGPEMIRRDVCANLLFLSVGFDMDEFNLTRASAYLAHMPSGTSVKNIAHWGQEVNSGRFAHFDHGILANEVLYGSSRAPDYELDKIRSKSLVMFASDNDWLASPKDVARLRRELKVTPFKFYNMTEFVPAWNHLDFVYGIDAGKLVNTRIIEAFHHFDE